MPKIRVKSHKRKLPSGKITNVVSHIRSLPKKIGKELGKDAHIIANKLKKLEKKAEKEIKKDIEIIKGKEHELEEKFKAKLKKKHEKELKQQEKELKEKGVLSEDENLIASIEVEDFKSVTLTPLEKQMIAHVRAREGITREELEKRFGKSAVKTAMKRDIIKEDKGFFGIGKGKIEVIW